MPQRLPRLLLGGLLGAFVTVATAQRPAHYEHANADLAHARELFDKAKYTAAQYELDQVVQRIRDAHDNTRVEAEFLSAICAVRLFHNDAPQRLLAFMDHHPENFHVEAVELELFRHYFNQKKFGDAIAWAGRVEEFGLAEADRPEFAFKKGYAYFQQDNYDRALTEFDKVKDGPTLYAPPATYYAAHINYTRRNYASALTGFEKLKNDEGFGRIVPYYIAQIQFLQGKYDALLEYAKPLLAEPEGTKRTGDINRLAGEAYFRTGQYKEALPYLEKSLQRTGVERGDRYIAGYAYYRNEQYKKAVDQFMQVVNNSTDSLAQLSSYHMADCYLKLSEKNYARNAFKKAYDLGNDARITEDALFNYAKLSYELSFDPYNEAIIALRDYLKKYPGSPRHDEAQEFLLDVFLKTKNYEEALVTLDAIKNKDIRLQGAYQKLAFDRGVELYEGRKYAEAITYFQKALTYKVDQKVNALAHYWLGESHYALEDYPAALRKYDDLRNSAGAYATNLYDQASYSMGYAYFKQKEYGEAATAFRRFVEANGVPADQKSDAFVRIGDSYFVNKDLATAITWYDKAIATNSSAKDYALYQKAMCQGLNKQPNEKIATLKKLLQDKPNSQHAADAKYELGETYIGLEKDTDALTYYQQVITQHGNSPRVRQSMLQSALIHRRQGKTDQALEEFKAVVAKYPDMKSAADALAGVESIYVEQGRVGEYEAYVKNLSFFDASTLDLDEKYYRSAELLYSADKCDQAVGAFQDYLAKYPNGAYALDAHFYVSDCLYRAQRYAEALPGFEQVIQRQAAHLEPALYGASDILYRDKRWEGALDHFVQLEAKAAVPKNVLVAQVGQLRCLKELGRNDQAALVAEKLLKNTEVKADLRAEAGLAVAQAALDRNELDKAYTAFKVVATGSSNAWGAEAKYNMAYTRHLQKKYSDAEKEVFDLVQKFPSYDHWKAKAFILLGDVYVQLDDRFQARTTWQSVIDHCEEPELVDEAKARLQNISASQVAPKDGGSGEEITVPMPGQ
ncbi:MAG TPA: tetratricopeptide repeat protein [Flavobacteriales bacterium]